ncbi:MAG: YgjP-like metallopeptidase domain-containing protein, partial [Synechococcales bacterium]|nr:YgjP-like metallopeptidase domain-containing protein [Synechococcales bacterium]
MSKPNFPSYQVRVSPKAKRVNLTISEVGELNIVVPVGFDHRKIPEILLSKQKWIETTTAKVKVERALLCQNAKVLPQEVNLIAIGESWQIQYTNHSEFLIRELDNNQL